MPNKKAAIKHLRQTKKRTLVNAIVKRRIKNLVKQGQKAIADGSIKEKHQALSHDLQNTVDKAVKKGLIKPNAGNRKKARFMKSINKSLAATKK